MRGRWLTCLEIPPTAKLTPVPWWGNPINRVINTTAPAAHGLPIWKQSNVSLSSTLSKLGAAIWQYLTPLGHYQNIFTSVWKTSTNNQPPRKATLLCVSQESATGRLGLFLVCSNAWPLHTLLLHSLCFLLQIPTLHGDQGYINRGTCSYPELTSCHVLTSAYVIIF